MNEIISFLYRGWKEEKLIPHMTSEFLMVRPIIRPSCFPEEPP